MIKSVTVRTRYSRVFIYFLVRVEGTEVSCIFEGVVQ